MTYKLSRSALETLSIVAYKQPLTRNEIEEIRGVDTAGVLDHLLEKKLIRICGRRESIGRPIIYGTTNEFLKFFGLKNIAELPSVDELLPPDLTVQESDSSEGALPVEEAQEKHEHADEGAAEEMHESVKEEPH